MKKGLIVISLILLIIIIVVLLSFHKDQISIPQYFCQTNNDCQLSCGWGAVNKTWYEDNKKDKDDCFDGCAGIGLEAKCVASSCQAFMVGKKVDNCTYRKTSISQ